MLRKSMYDSTRPTRPTVNEEKIKKIRFSCASSFKKKVVVGQRKKERNKGRKKGGTTFSKEIKRTSSCLTAHPQHGSWGMPLSFMISKRRVENHPFPQRQYRHQSWPRALAISPTAHGLQRQENRPVHRIQEKERDEWWKLRKAWTDQKSQVFRAIYTIRMLWWAVKLTVANVGAALAQARVPLSWDKRILDHRRHDVNGLHMVRKISWLVLWSIDPRS